MLWAITALTFVATFAILAAVFYAFAPGGAGIATRLVSHGEYRCAAR